MKYTDIPTDGVYIAFVRSKNPLARIIQFGMWLFQILQMKRYPTKSFNHTDLVFEGLVVGAQRQGIVATNIEHAYKKKNPNIELYQVPVEGEEQFDLLWSFILETLGTPYEFSNFWYHAKKIFTGKWSTRTDERFYCIEHTAEAMSLIKEGFCEDPRSLNPVEFLEIVREKLFEVE